ncbi:hypothetical protein GMMP1_90002 [Candidatus Magnetomoraceae bacterium gMMP-1]
MNKEPSKATKRKMKKLDTLNKKGVKGNKRAARKSIKLAQELEKTYLEMCQKCRLHTMFGIIF